MSLLSKKIEVIVQNLVRSGSLTEAKLKEARELAEKEKKTLQEIILEKAYLNESSLAGLVAKEAGLSSLSLETYNPDEGCTKLLSAEQAHKWQAFPLFETEGRLTVAVADPFDASKIDGLRRAIPDVELVVSPPSELEARIRKTYGAHLEASAPKQAKQTKAEKNLHSNSSIDASQVIVLVENTLRDALKERASDVHFEPTRDGMKVRFRVDGALEVYQTFPKNLQEAILSRVKILGEMDVAEHRLQQDGRTSLEVDNINIDMRIATYPTMFGEAAAIRLHTKDHLIELVGLGFSEHDQKIFEKIIHHPHGIFLTTGPTGSGKTTTLYAALQGIDRQTNHVMSVEDPIENEIEGVDQTQINEKAGVKFSTVLRGMLRQDPDVIMVGEIRDSETAEIALSAAMTGHLVFSTLHTNSSIAAVARLVDLGIDPFLISSTLLGVLAQRLVRLICPHCEKVPVPLTQDLKDRLGLLPADNFKTFKGKGCSKCHDRGYLGRLGLFELFYVDSEIRVLLNNSAPEVRLKEKAITSGFRTILEDGLEKAKKGLTTLDEVLRVCGEV